jgi:hypothetical protein
LLDALAEPWSSWISEADVRFRDLFPEGSGTIAERIDALTGDPTSPPRDLIALGVCVRALRERLRELEQKTIEASLAEFVELTASVSERRLGGLLARLHFSGAAERSTLELAGAFAGITRERMRQIERRYLDRLPNHPIVMPAVDRAVSLLRSNAPVDLASASEILQKEGISRIDFHPASVLAAAAACKRPAVLEISLVRGLWTVVVGSDSDLANLVIRVANKTLALSNVSNIEEVATVLTATYKKSITDMDVRRILMDYSDIEFLGDEWFWSPARSNDAIRTNARRMLSVTAVLDVATMREGIRRHFRFRQSMARRRGLTMLIPPRQVLVSYFLAHPEFVVLENERVKALRPIDYRMELGTVEQVIVDTLNGVSTNLLDRPSVIEGCAERGVNPNSVSTMLSYSSIVEQVTPGIWTLRGRRVDPAAVEALRRENAERPRQQRVVSYGWTADGRLRVSVRLPRNFETQVFGIPSPMRRFIAGRSFDAKDENGIESGTIRVYEYGQCGGYERFLRRMGADEGDILTMLFSLSAGTAELTIDDDTALELVDETGD